MRNLQQIPKLKAWDSQSSQTHSATQLILPNKLNTWQYELITLINNNPDVDNFVITASRQIGKSTLGSWLATDISLKEDELYSWYVLPFYKQCSELFKNKFLPYLNKQGIKHKANKSELSIQFHNGSVLQFQSAENYQSLRSATLDYLFIDELAFMRPEVLPYALFPMMTAKGRKTFMWSTPRGKNHFYDLYQRGEKKMKGWLSFHGHYSKCDNQRQIDIIEKLKLTMLPDAFRQEYDAEFVDKSGQVFKDIQNAFTLNEFALPTERNFGGVDIGMDKDRTVITIVNERCEVIYYKRYELNEQSDTEYLVNSLSEILLMFPNVKCFVEKNFNPSVFQLLRKRNPNVYYFNTNNETKKELITNLQYYISAGLLSSPNIPIMVDEMLSYELGTTKVRNSFTFNAPAGGHDDTIISIGLACILHRNLMKGITI